MNPQYTFDSKGKAVGVFLPIEEWDEIQKILSADDLPQWQKNMLDIRLKAIAENPDRLRPIEELFSALDEED
jgi:hypothetical protein